MDWTPSPIDLAFVAIIALLLFGKVIPEVIRWISRTLSR